MSRTCWSLCGLVLCLSVYAQQGPPPETDYVFDFTPFVEEVDTDGNGKLSLAEWQAAGVCDSIFSMLHGSDSGEMTVDELTARMPQKEAEPG